MKNFVSRMSIVLIMLTIILPISAQVGFKVGPNVSWFAGESPQAGFDKKCVGLFAGFDFNIPLSERVNLVPEIIYIHQGAFDTDEQRTYSMYSATIITSVSYDIGRLNISAGPYIERLLGVRNYSFSGGNYTWPVPNWDYWKLWDVGGNWSARYNLIPLGIEVSYKRGFICPKKDPLYDPRFNNSYITGIRTSLYFPLNKWP